VPVADVIAWARFRHQGFGRIHKRDQAAIDQVIVDFSLEDLRERPFTALSGGEQRRVLLARAAASTAPLILLDEPVAHLDMHHILELQQAFGHLQQQGKTLLMVLHDLRDVSVCADAAVVLGQQQLHGPDTLEQLIESGIVQDVYGVSIGRSEQYTFDQPH
jgi:iron complex transport system ATP-binding protein